MYRSFLLQQGETDSTAEQGHQVMETEVFETVGGAQVRNTCTNYLLLPARVLL